MLQPRMFVHRAGPAVFLGLMLVLGSMSCGKKSEDHQAPVKTGGERGTKVAQQSETGTARGTEEAQTSRTPSTMPPESSSQGARRSGTKAPDFSLVGLDGSTVRLSDHAGKVVLIDFWATWCGPCRLEIPHLIELDREYGPRGFVVLGISLDQAGVSAVRSFVESMRIPYPVAMGTQATVQAYGSIRAIPTAFLIDREGYIAGRYEGYREKRFFESKIKALLEGTPVS